MNAIVLRNILLGTIALVIALIGVTIYYASNFLTAETTKSVHTQIDAQVSTQDLDRLKNLEKVLNDNRTSVQKAAQIVAETKQYQYQDQVINDINRYATQTGVRVTGFDFGDPNAPQAPVSGAKAAPPGVKAIAVTLSLQTPLPFDNYLRFIKAIEQNLTKMQISGVNLTPDARDINSVANPSIQVTVYGL